MDKPKMSPMTPVNGFVVPPNGPPPPNSIPYQFESNMIPGQNAPTLPWNETQVGPQHFFPTTTHQWYAQPGMIMQSNPNYIIPQPTNPTSWLQTFKKGKPKALGIVLILTAICQIALGIVLPFISLGSITFYSGIEYWSTIFYIITGSFTISAEKRQSIPQVKASFGLNIASAIITVAGIIINILDFFVVYCDLYYGCDYYYRSPDGAYIVLGILLLLNLQVFCVTVSIAVFGGRALDQMPSNVPSMFVIQNVVPGPPSAYPPNTSGFPAQPNLYTQK
ncbi:membrane-spanning 4-domains subfamily A member 4A-like [Dendrobates tinctorius]|uniref:membrane-spanning 4-domains subfamily A member 4A-like n=1 Tax=Dendrobates tinctorius TaxID=92724 RepID=UPI003CC94886